MSTMRYTLFQNTLDDLRECYSLMSQCIDIDDMDLSEGEIAAMRGLIRLCKRIAIENE